MGLELDKKGWYDCNMKVIRHIVNNSGRDFIIGDLHGFMDSLDALMSHVNFDYSADRLFSVGDLVDRGPHSEKALDLIGHQWFYPVMGNHDMMLLKYIESHLSDNPRSLDQRTRTYSRAFSLNGGEGWVRPHLSDHDLLNSWVTKLKSMPLVRCVDSTHPFNVAHAELIAVENTDAGKWTQHTLSESASLWDKEHHIVGFDDYGSWEDHVMWGREIRFGITHNANIEYPDLHRTYVGHTVTKAKNGVIVSAFNHVFMDTGAMHIGNNPDFGLCMFDHSNNVGFMHNGSEIIDLHIPDTSQVTMCP